MLAVAAHRGRVVLTQVVERGVDLGSDADALALDTNGKRLRVFVVVLGGADVLVVGLVDLGDNNDELLDRSLAQQGQQKVLL